jgi:hypothetical protein
MIIDMKKIYRIKDFYIKFQKCPLCKEELDPKQTDSNWDIYLAECEGCGNFTARLGLMGPRGGENSGEIALFIDLDDGMKSGKSITLEFYDTGCCIEEFDFSTGKTTINKKISDETKINIKNLPSLIDKYKILI